MNHNGHYLILKQFYLSSEWAETRRKFLRFCREQKIPFVCNLCSVKLCFASDSEKNKIGKKILNVDHILPVKYYWEKRLDIDNLQLLCENCNKIKSNTIDKEDINLKIKSNKIEIDIINDNPDIIKNIPKESEVIAYMHQRFNESKPSTFQPTKFNMNKGFLLKNNMKNNTNNTVPISRDEIEVNNIVDENGKIKKVFKLPRKFF